jgi:DNA-binding LytR/AlgR family response regulator
VQPGGATLLVFITNYDALVYQSFRYHPFGFIRKSYFEQEIGQVISSAVQVLESRDENLVVRVNNEVLRIQLSEIIYFEAELNYVKAVTGTVDYTFRESLGKLEEKLFPKGFIRTHKGFIVNQQYIHAFRNSEIELSNGIRIPIGRANKEKVKKYILKYLR